MIDQLRRAGRRRSLSYRLVAAAAAAAAAAASRLIGRLLPRATLGSLSANKLFRIALQFAYEIALAADSHAPAPRAVSWALLPRPFTLESPAAAGSRAIG